MRRLLVVLFLAACGGGSGGSSSTSSSGGTLLVQASTGSLSVAPGSSLQLQALQMQPGGAYGGGYALVTASWSSSNTAVATVDAGGLVMGVAAGSAVITAHAGSSSGQATVTVGNGGVATIEWNLTVQNNPLTTTIAAGTPVQWHTVDTSTGHTITPDTQAPPNAATLNPGGTTATQTITTPGTYHYHCTIHPTMHGTLIVQ